MKPRLPPGVSVRAEPQRIEECHAAAADLLVDHAVEPHVKYGAEVPARGQARQLVATDAVTDDRVKQWPERALRTSTG